MSWNSLRSKKLRFKLVQIPQIYSNFEHLFVFCLLCRTARKFSENILFAKMHVVYVIFAYYSARFSELSDNMRTKRPILSSQDHVYLFIALLEIMFMKWLHCANKQVVTNSIPFRPLIDEMLAECFPSLRNAGLQFLSNFCIHEHFICVHVSPWPVFWGKQW